MRINRLTDPIDIFSEWIDMSEAVNRDGGRSAGGARVRQRTDDDEDEQGWHGEEDADAHADMEGRE